MAVVTRAAAKLRLGVLDADTSEDEAIDALVLQVQALAESYLNFPLDYAVRTETYSGTGREWLALAGKPVYWIPCEGVTTSGSASVTGLSATSVIAATLAAAGVVAGMPAAGVGVPSGATVVSVDSATAVTLSAACTETDAEAAVCFGLSVWSDESGGFGGGAARLGTADTLLEPWSDYEVRLDGRGALAGMSSSGLIQRVGGVWPRWQGRQSGTLAPFTQGPLGGGQAQGAVRVHYASGFNSTNCPHDVKLAVLDVLALVRQASPFGTFKSSESWDGYSYSLAGLAGETWLGYLAGPGGAALHRWRRRPV